MNSPFDDPEVRRLVTALAVVRRESKTRVTLHALRAEMRRIRRRLKEPG
jgi:hypothetical protein